MATTSVASVYLHVVDDVINKVREDFLNYGVGENILNELQGLWEMKMMQCGAISGNIERTVSKANGVLAPVHDLNVPYEGPTEEYETPTAEMLFPPTPLQTPIPTPLPGLLENQLYQTGTPNDFEHTEDLRDGDAKALRPNPFMPPPSPWMSQRPLGVDVNIAYNEVQDEVDRGVPRHPRTQDFFMGSSGKRKRGDYPSQLPPDGFIPQQDGASDVIIEFTLQEDMKKDDISSARSLCLPQLDGINDDYGSPYNPHGDAGEDYHTLPPENAGTPRMAQGAEIGDDEPPLNEDDDDDEDDFDDLDQEEEEPNTQHLVLALFDKVTRAKNRWKCMLKNGIMHLNNRDILFNKANGEFEF
ncbi:transcription initiation factor IIA large subunit-like [Wolffia australiana]